MRTFVVLLSLFVTVGTADAQKARKQPEPTTRKRDNRTATREDGERKSKDRAQSFGLPWEGHLQGGTQLKVGEHAFIRRPYRAFGTRTTVEYIKRAIAETVELYPRVHVLSIGDLSAESGGQVSDHHSHQSGRDADIGLYYKKQPAGYPGTFINATEQNLDCAATFALISKLAATADKDGGVQVIFLDYQVQGIIYRWAKAHNISDKKLERLFQYAHGEGSNQGLVRHYRNHQHHIHVRFSCAKADRDCVAGVH